MGKYTTVQASTEPHDTSTDVPHVESREGVSVHGTSGDGPRLHPAVPGLLLCGLLLIASVSISSVAPGLPLLVIALVGGLVARLSGLVLAEHEPGMAVAERTLLRFGIVLLGLRLAVGDITALGSKTLAMIVATVAVTFVGTQLIGRRLGLSPGLSLLVASGFSICGNSAIASVNQAADADDDEVAAAIGLVTVCGMAAVFLLPQAGGMLGLSEAKIGVWAGASVQDTAQVLAASATAGPIALAVATAVKLTRILCLAPIVAGVSLWKQRTSTATKAATEEVALTKTPPIFPLFVVGFMATVLLRTSGVLPTVALDQARSVEQYALAAGMVGLGSAVRPAQVRALGAKPLVLGLAAWVLVTGVPLVALTVFGVYGTSIP